MKAKPVLINTFQTSDSFWRVPAGLVAQRSKDEYMIMLILPPKMLRARWWLPNLGVGAVAQESLIPFVSTQLKCVILMQKGTIWSLIHFGDCLNQKIMVCKFTRSDWEVSTNISQLVSQPINQSVRWQQQQSVRSVDAVDLCKAKSRTRGWKCHSNKKWMEWDAA